MVKQNSVKTNPWTAMLWGFLAFLLSGLLASVIIWRFDNYVLGTIITGAMGGLLLGLFTRQRGSLSKFAMGGGFGMPIALFLTFALLEGLGSLILRGDASVSISTVSDILAIILFGAFFGLIFGIVVYGKKAAGTFLLTGGLLAIPFGIFVGLMNANEGIQKSIEEVISLGGIIDLNFFAMALAIGLGAGLGVGLYSRGKKP